MRTVLAAAAVAVALGSACHRERDRKPLPPDDAIQILHDRIWIDHVPRGQQDRFHLALFDPEGVGLVQHRTIWKGDFEIFFHAADGARLTIDRPDRGRGVTVGFTVEPARTREGADARLTIDQSPFGVKTYLGFKPEGQTSPDAWLAARFGRDPAPADR